MKAGRSKTGMLGTGPLAELLGISAHTLQR
jgi:hypothetical protein